MRPTPIQHQPALIDLLTGSIEGFLRTERGKGNHCWFTGEEIAAKLALPDQLAMAFTFAFSRLRFDRLEIDGDTIRHRR